MTESGEIENLIATDEPAVIEPEPQKKKFDRTIVEGPLSRAVWKIAWPSMLTNAIGGVQGMVDHALVGHLVGPIGNAAIGVSLQLWIAVAPPKGRGRRPTVPLCS